MKNKLTDLNNHLFAQIERLSEEGINPELLQTEVSRTEAIIRVSDQIIKTASLSLKAAHLGILHGDFVKIKQVAPIIDGPENKTFEMPPEKLKALK